MSDNHTISLGHDHTAEFVSYGGEIAGVNVPHLNPQGAECVGGWAPFNGRAWAKQFETDPNFQAWDVIKEDPLTIQPSLLCTVCGDHGFITEGKWVIA